MIWIIIIFVIIFLVGLVLSFFYPSRLFFDIFFDNVITNGDRKLPKIALTFDDGPDPTYTPQVLEILKKYNINATFFLIGENAEKHPELVKKIDEDNHSIGIHSYEHIKLIFLKKKNIKKQLEKCENILKGILGEKPTFFRPPYGFRDPRVLSIAKKMGFYTVLWDVTAFDWETPGVEKIIDNIMKQVYNGSIILLHDSRGDRTQTINTLDRIIPTLEKKNYTFVKIDEILDDLEIK